MLRAVVLIGLLTGPQSLMAMKGHMGMDMRPEGTGPMTFFPHAGASGTEHNRPHDDPDFLRTNSEMPLLPTVYGYVGTHGIFVPSMRMCRWPVVHFDILNFFFQGVHIKEKPGFFQRQILKNLGFKA